MKFRITVKKKLDTINFSEPSILTNVSNDGTFEAQAINFAKTSCNTYIRDYTTGIGVKMRTQKEWAKNIKTKNFEKVVMVQNGDKPETLVFVLEQL